MASGDVVFEFSGLQLSKMSMGPTTTVVSRVRTPQQYVLSNANGYALPNDESLILPTATLDVTHQSDDQTGDAFRTGFVSRFDGTKRYKLTVTEV